jgi:hypothetical protein
MPGAVFDLLTGKDLWEDVPAPREGTNVTAVRDDPTDGPVRPGYQTLANQAFWLRNGVVNGVRTLGSAHLSAAGGALPSSANPGELIVEQNALVGTNLTVGGHAIVNGSAAVKGFISAGLATESMLYTRSGNAAGANLVMLDSALSWQNVNLGYANPHHGDDSVRNRQHAKNILKMWGIVKIQGGKIVYQEGYGGWTAQIAVYRTPPVPHEPIRFQIAFPRGSQWATPDDYTMHADFFMPPGSRAEAVDMKPVTQETNYCEWVAVAGPAIVNLSVESNCKIFFTIAGVYR